MTKKYVSMTAYMEYMAMVYEPEVQPYKPCTFGYDEGEIYG